MSSTLPTLISLLQLYGYVVLWVIIFFSAAGLPLPVSLLLLAAGAFAELGDFNFALLAAVSISAFVAGDSLGYWVGRFWGSRLLAWLEKSGRFVKPQTIVRSRAYFQRRGGLAVFFSRFLVPALGGIVNILAGAQLYPYQRFLFYDLTGETLGALLPLTLGLICGASWEAVGSVLGSLSLLFLTLIVVCYLGYLTFWLVSRLRGTSVVTAAAREPVGADAWPFSSTEAGAPVAEPSTPTKGHLPL
jgi:membrane-associated protein